MDEFIVKCEMLYCGDRAAAYFFSARGVLDRKPHAARTSRPQNPKIILRDGGSSLFEFFLASCSYRFNIFCHIFFLFILSIKYAAMSHKVFAKVSRNYVYFYYFQYK